VLYMSEGQPTSPRLRRPRKGRKAKTRKEIKFMKKQTPLTKSISPVTDSLKRSPRHSWTTTGLLVTLVLICFALSPQARAVCRDGCNLTNGNTFQGNDALLSTTTGYDNVAVGASALASNTDGPFNTAIGFEALSSSPSTVENTA